MLFVDYQNKRKRGLFSCLRDRSGFSLVEMCVVILLLWFVLNYVASTIDESRRKALEAKASATVVQLNAAAMRARIEGETGVGTFGSDPVGAMKWYVSNGYIQEEVDLFGVAYVDGVWELALPW